MHRTSLPIKPIDDSTLYVIAVVSNPARFRTRYDLYRKFEAHMKASGAQLVTVEIAFGDRPFEVTEADNKWHVQLRTSHELWHKENMGNVGLTRLPPSWKYVAWIDADVAFMRQDWVQETVHQLQHYHFVQMFSTAIDLGPSPGMNPIGINYGFVYCYQNQHQSEVPPLLVDKRLNHNRHSGCYDPYRQNAGNKVFWHPGYAWAARREAIEHVGGLLDTGILGAGDHHMSLALIGRALEAMPPNVTAGYQKTVLDWQERCSKYIRRNVGYVSGTIYHFWHGKKASRKYWSRWKILTENKFDPFLDLKRDWQGLWQLVDHGDDKSVNLRDQIRAYFRSRDEDSLDE